MIAISVRAAGLPAVVEHASGNGLVPVVTDQACGDPIRHEDLMGYPQVPSRTVAGPAA